MAEQLLHNQLTLTERLQTILISLPLPAVLIWALIKSLFSGKGKKNSWRRILIRRMILWVISVSNRKQMRAFFGESRDTYNAFMKSKKLEPVVDELGDDARLLWIGPKANERVVLVLHGGAFIFGMMASLPEFWYHVQEKVEDKGKRIGVAILNYSLVPDGKFPTQLRQAILALQHLLDSGVKPENIQLAGDSAGAMLIHQILSQILHPLEGLPRINLSGPLGGAYLMSPWANMRDNPLFYTNLGKDDIIDVPMGIYWASIVLDGISPGLLPYIEANSSPEGWLEGVEKHVKRIFISIGTSEILRDSSIKYAKTVQRHHKETIIFMHEDGIHIDPYLAFLVQDQDLGPVTSFLIDWLDIGFL